MPSDYFWEDLDQASQRLRNSIVPYDGLPCHISEVRPHTDGIPRAILQMLPLSAAQPIKTKSLASPKFKRFRESVPLGFINCFFGGKIRTCSFLERQTNRTVVHGLNNGNVRAYRFYENGSFENEYNFMNYVNDPSFVDMAIGNYPSLRESFDNLVDGSTVAIHRKYALAKYANKVTLYRERRVIGPVPDGNTILLFRNKIHWKEELIDLTKSLKTFEGINVREF